MGSRERFFALIVGIVVMISLPSSSYASDPSPAQSDSAYAAPQRWSSFLPFMKEEALARGHELPLPFGISVIYNYVGRDISVTDVRIGINGEAPRGVSEYLDLGSTSSVNAGLLKVDAWLLPFVNVYLLGGYLKNESISRGHVVVPRPGPIPGPPLEFNSEIVTTLEGVVLGAGTSVAAGYNSFLLMADINYSKTDIGFDDNFRALVISTRAGWFGKVGTVPCRFWLGGAYWDTKNVARSTVEVEGVGTVSFEADQGPRNPWNAAIGGSVVLSPEWETMAEYGFNFDDVQFLAVGVTYRF